MCFSPRKFPIENGGKTLEKTGFWRRKNELQCGWIFAVSQTTEFQLPFNPLLTRFQQLFHNAGYSFDGLFHLALGRGGSQTDAN